MTTQDLQREVIAFAFLVIAAFTLPDPWGFYFALLVLAGWLASHPQQTNAIAKWFEQVGTL